MNDIGLWIAGYGIVSFLVGFVFGVAFLALHKVEK